MTDDVNAARDETLTEHVERRKSDPQFKKLLEDILAKHERLLRMLRDGRAE